MRGRSFRRRRRVYRPRRRYFRRTNYRGRHIRRHESRWYQLAADRLPIPSAGNATCGTQVMSLRMSATAMTDRPNWGYYKITKTVHRYKLCGQIGEYFKANQLQTIVTPGTGTIGYGAVGNGPDGIHLTYLVDRDGWTEEGTYTQMLTDPRARTVLLRPNKQVSITSRRPSMATPIYEGAAQATAGVFAWKQSAGYISTDYPDAYWYGLVVGLHNATERTLDNCHITREIWIKVTWSMAKNQYFMRRNMEYINRSHYGGDLTTAEAAITMPFPADNTAPDPLGDRPPAEIPLPAP